MVCPCPNDGLILAAPPKASMSQISIFASLNHIHHHTYFKNSYVHIQVFHILHYHTMKLLQAFKSFLTRESIVENRQWKLVRCWPHNSAAKLIHCTPHNSVTKIVSLQALQFRKWMLLRCSQHIFSSEC